MSLAIDGTAAFGSRSGVSTVSATLTTTVATDVIVAVVFNENTVGASLVTTTGVKLTTAGTAFTKFASLTIASDDELSIWWLAPGSTISQTITATASGTGADDSNIFCFGVSGANTSSPWDAATGAPFHNTASTNVAPSVSGVSTINANALLFGFCGVDMSATTGTLTETAGAMAGTTGTLVSTSNGSGGGATLHVEDRLLSATISSQSVAFGTASGTTAPWGIFAAAIVAASTAAANPVQNFDFPNPPRTYWYQHWQSSGLLFGQIPYHNYDWPNPRTYTPIDQFYEFGNVQFLVKQPASFFHNYDFPNPYPVTWYRDWSNPGLKISVQFPFYNRDWPNPRTYQPIDQFYEFGNVQFLTLQPASYFHNYDFPNPYPVNWYKSWEFSNLTQITQQPASYFHNYDFPNPQPITWYRDWYQNLLENTLTPTFQFPFNQYTWPVPIGNPRPDEFYSFSNLGVISNQPASFFRNYDFPNPPPIQWYQSWTDVIAPYVPVLQPFAQYDWPNPQPVTWYRDWFQALVPYLPVSAFPFNQYDWPLPRGPQPIDQTWLQSLVLNLPEPPPPPTLITGGKQWTQEEWEKRVLQMWMKKIRAM